MSVPLKVQIARDALAAGADGSLRTAAEKVLTDYLSEPTSETPQEPVRMTKRVKDAGGQWVDHRRDVLDNDAPPNS